MGFPLLQPGLSSEASDRPVRLYLLAFFMVVIGACALPLDMALSKAILPAADGVAPLLRLPGDLRRVISLSEVFGHGTGLLLIGLTVVVLDPIGRRRAVRLMTIAFTGGMLAALTKGLIARTRPNHSELTGAVAETFQTWLPLGSTDYATQSTPSGHAAQAVAMGVALAWRYPRGRSLFLFFAALACTQRIVDGAHFLSDVFWGGAIGLGVAALMLDRRALGKFFDRWERKPPAKIDLGQKMNRKQEGIKIRIDRADSREDKQLPFVIEQGHSDGCPYTLRFPSDRPHAA